MGGVRCEVRTASGVRCEVRYANALDSLCSTMPPTAFCRDALNELASMSHNDGWVRGAYAVCEMYGAADAGRFESILKRLSLGTGGTALTEGASWLLARWQFAQTGHS